MEKEKEVKDFSIEKEDQKRLKGISKFLYIIAKISKVFAIVGIAFMVLAMILVPIVSSNIKIVNNSEGKALKVFDGEFNYTRTESSFVMYEKDKTDDKLEFTDQKEIDAANKVMDYLEQDKLSKAAILVEVEFVFVIASLVIDILILNKVYTFFKNIHDESTPFMQENADLLRGVSKLLIVSFVLSIIINIISSAMLDSEMNVSVVGIVEILLTFFLTYIFEYGVRMQNSTKGKIYSKGE